MGFNKWWTILHAPLSWTAGVALLVYTTVTGKVHQDPEWYVIIGGLLGGPFLTFWKDKGKEAGR